MHKVIGMSLGLFILGSAGLAQALTLQWDRNTEADMALYTVYGCATPGCTVTAVPALKIGSVPQPAVGVIPSFVLPAGIEGRVGVTASDLAGNESGMSVPIPFGDTTAPSIPKNLRVAP